MKCILHISRFPICLEIRPNGPFAYAVLTERTPYGTLAMPLAKAINLALSPNRVDDLRAVMDGLGFAHEGASVLPLRRWSEQKIARVLQLANGYFESDCVADLWLCQGFDDDDFAVLPYQTLLKILEVAQHFKEYGKLPEGY